MGTKVVRHKSEGKPVIAKVSFCCLDELRSLVEAEADRHGDRTLSTTSFGSSLRPLAGPSWPSHQSPAGPSKDASRPRSNRLAGDSPMSRPLKPIPVARPPEPPLLLELDDGTFIPRPPPPVRRTLLGLAAAVRGFLWVGCIGWTGLVTVGAGADPNPSTRTLGVLLVLAGFVIAYALDRLIDVGNS